MTETYYAVSLQHKCGTMVGHTLCDVKWITTDRSIAEHVCTWLKDHPAGLKSICGDDEDEEICDTFIVIPIIDLARLIISPGYEHIILEPIYQNYYYHEGIVNEFIPKNCLLYNVDQIKQHKKTAKYTKFNEKVRRYAKELEDIYPKTIIDKLNKYLETADASGST